MESLREAIGAQLAEELREQVNHLSAALQLLTPVVQEQGEQRYGQYLAIANQSIYRLIRTINHLEDIRLPEREAAGMGPLDLAGLCSQTAKQVCSLAERAGVSFRYDSERESLLSCGDGALLERMLLGLISNALKWAGEDKTGERAGEAGLHLAADRGRAVITVWDNGPGLHSGRRDGDNSLPLLHTAEGAGLGLAAARRIAAVHGGTLVLEQRENRGLRAVVSLPIRTPERPEEVRTPQMGYDRSGGFSPALVELSDVLPFAVFLPEDIE